MVTEAPTSFETGGMSSYLALFLRGLARAAGLAGITLTLAAAAPAAAATVAEQAAYEAAFDAMQRDPGNSDKALAYAETAIKVGDLEGAIGALERLLIFNPDLPRIRLELGVLYYRLGSYDLARSYLAPLAERGDVAGDVQSKSREYLAQIDRAASPHQLSGALVSGFRYQTNATYGPGGSSIRILGLDFPVASSVNKKGDANFFGLGGLHYVYDFQRADLLTVETNLTVYGAKQFRQGQLDLSLTQLDVGPRIGLPWLRDGANIRPYVVGDYLSLSGTSFMSSYGGGVGFFSPAVNRVGVDVLFEIQNRQYPMDTERPRIESRNGNFIVTRVAPYYEIADNQRITLIGEFDRTLAVQGYESNTQFVLGPSYAIRFVPPVEQLGTRPWTGTVGFNRVWRTYDEPDVLIDPFNTRRDSEWNLGGTLEIGLADQFSLLLQVQHSWVDSTIPNYSYRNFIGAAALGVTF